MPAKAGICFPEAWGFSPVGSALPFRVRELGKRSNTKTLKTC